MDWIFEHLKILIFIGGGIAYWLAQRKKAQDEAEAARRMASTPPPQATTQVNDEAERVRRIQEEIRRKILERTGGGTVRQAPPATQKPVQAVPPPMPKALAKPDAYAQAPVEERGHSIEMAILDQQKQLAEKIRELDEKRGRVIGKAEAFAEKTASVMTESDTAVRGSLLADLRNPTSVRRAIVLREVLGTPVGLR